LKHTVPIITDAQALQNLFYTTWVRGVACQKTTLEPNLAGAGLGESPKILGPPIYFCNHRSMQLKIWYTSWVWRVAYEETTSRIKICGGWGYGSIPKILGPPTYFCYRWS